MHVIWNAFNKESPEISSLLFGVWLQRQIIDQSINDLLSDLTRNSVCACVHPERLMNGHLFNDGVKLLTVTYLRTPRCKVVLDAYSSNIGASERWTDFSGQHLESCRLSSSTYAKKT